ncbi:uncharacterized protein LOC122367621 [Amphibalanus amphitrite]|uniref:uncharacterized protein LOC122367621 n=1 Tax=Amphibalanus amphitrite TaxID=1232801 RepID=UPI001C8FD194|nr:uncharacterized protein LOC122367621 [Amphibalanus amphitrite]
MSTARWMAHVIYGIKMFLFRHQLLELGIISKDMHDKLRRFAVFVCLFYVKEWLTCTTAADAAVSDLSRYQDLNVLRRVDPKVAEAAMEVYGRHTWYLTQELVTLALVSSLVDPPTKRRMADVIHEYATEQATATRMDKPDLPTLPTEAGQVKALELDDFIGPESRTVFGVLGISAGFLRKPLPWDGDPDFDRPATFVLHLRVTNDTAERGVKLISDFIGHITTSDFELQELLQVVEAHCQRYPDYSKATLSAAV